jgi:hypothetical protein
MFGGTTIVLIVGSMLFVCWVVYLEIRDRNINRKGKS